MRKEKVMKKITVYAPDSNRDGKADLIPDHYLFSIEEGLQRGYVTQCARFRGEWIIEDIFRDEIQWDQYIEIDLTPMAMDPNALEEILNACED